MTLGVLFLKLALLSLGGRDRASYRRLEGSPGPKPVGGLDVVIRETDGIRRAARLGDTVEGRERLSDRVEKQLRGWAWKARLGNYGAEQGAQPSTLDRARSYDQLRASATLCRSKLTGADA